MRLLKIVSAIYLALALNASADQKNSPGVIDRGDIRNARLVAVPGETLELIIEFTEAKTAALAGDTSYASGCLIVAGRKLEIPTLGRVTTTRAGTRNFTITPPDIESAVAILNAISEPSDPRHSSAPTSEKVPLLSDIPKIGQVFLASSSGDRVPLLSNIPRIGRYFSRPSSGRQTDRSTAPASDAWEESFLDYLKTSNHAVLVCVTHVLLEHKALPDKHKLYLEATVVRSFNGGFVVGERISYYRLLEEIPANLPAARGDLEYLFLATRGAQPLFLDVGQGWKYDAHLEQLMERP